jgi:hypothetical protein
MALALGAGCLYTDPINTAPRVQIAMTSDKIERGKGATFGVAGKIDDESPGKLKVQWAKGPPPCPRTLAEADEKGPPQSAPGTTFAVTPTTLDDFCVWAIATDEHGARSLATVPGNKPFEVENRPPEASIEVVEPKREPPYDLMSRFRLSGAKSEDPDKDLLTGSWEIFDPTGAPMPSVCAEKPAPLTACFTAPVPGRYRAVLSVTDEVAEGKRKTSRAKELELVVRGDRPACIVATEPNHMLPRLVRDHTTPTKFVVNRVDDDYAPWGDMRASSQGEFRWSVRSGRPGPFEPRATRRNELSFEAYERRPGDRLDVRVEYRDRESKTSTARTLNCGDEDARCGLEPGCSQIVTWTVEYY